MIQMETHFDNTSQFQDITGEPIEFQFPEEEIVAGHRFRHVYLGLYKAEPAFEVTEEELGEILLEYRDIKLEYPSPHDTCDMDEAQEQGPQEKKPFIYKICYGFWIELFEHDEVGSEFHYRKKFSNMADGSDWYESLKGLADWAELFEMQHVDLHSFWECGGHDLKEKLPPKKEAFVYTNDIAEVTEEINVLKPKVIQFQGCIGHLVEEGIYYFGKLNGIKDIAAKNIPFLDYSTAPPLDMAVIGHTRDFHPTFYLHADYISFDRQYFPRLYELMCEVSEYDSDTYYSEYPAEKEKEAKQGEENRQCNSRMQDLEDGIVIEADAEELVQGLGFRDLELMYKMVYETKHKMREYEAAYKLGDDLVLVRIDPREKSVKREKHNMKLMEKLFVKEKRLLKCEVNYTMVHKIIDCGLEKWKELLTPEAYEVFAVEQAEEAGGLRRPEG